MRLKWYYLLECLHTLFVTVFYPTIRKKSKLENLLYDEETECFEKKTHSSFKKTSRPKWEGAKKPAVAGRLFPDAFSWV